MTVLKRTVVACAFAVLLLSCSTSVSQNKNQTMPTVQYSINSYELPSEAEIQKIKLWLNEVNQFGTVIANETMQPIFDLNGASRLTKSDAAIVMELDTLKRLRRTAYYFGDTLIINDAIAKAGTSRETHTPNSEHFSGRAVDISVRGMTDAEKIKLVESALKAGFTGFGFGRDILHVDTGRNRWWAYGNSTFGGISVVDLGKKVKAQKE